MKKKSNKTKKAIKSVEIVDEFYADMYKQLAKDCPEAINIDGSIYLSEGISIFPDGSTDDDEQ